jgi:hypothetical protein
MGMKTNSELGTVTSGKIYKQLVVGWTVRGSNPGWGGEILRALGSTQPPVR